MRSSEDDGFREELDPSTSRLEPKSKQYHPLRHAARHEASDVDPQRTAQRAYVDRPHHRPTSPVRFLDHGVVRNIPPLVFNPDPIMSVLGFPIDIRQRSPISVGATRTFT